MEMEKEVNNSACLKWDFRLETPGEAVAAIKHSIRRERQFPECGSRGGREKHPCGNPDPIPVWERAPGVASVVWRVPGIFGSADLGVITAGIVWRSFLWNNSWNCLFPPGAGCRPLPACQGWFLDASRKALVPQEDSLGLLPCCFFGGWFQPRAWCSPCSHFSLGIPTLCGSSLLSPSLIPKFPGADLGSTWCSLHSFSTPSQTVLLRFIVGVFSLWIPRTPCSISKRGLCCLEQLIQSPEVTGSFFQCISSQGSSRLALALMDFECGT